MLLAIRLSWCCGLHMLDCGCDRSTLVRLAAIADSAQGGGYAGPNDPESPAVNVLDGDNATIWHTQYSGTPSPLPHMLTVVMGGGVNKVSGFMVRSHRCAQTLVSKRCSSCTSMTCALQRGCRSLGIRGARARAQSCICWSRCAPVQYVPRQDGGATINGNVGQYEIRLSTDGTTFPSAAVAKGTWANTAAAKYVKFPAANAKAVRLTALTEAGGNGPWTSAAEVNVLGTVVSPPDSSTVGSWEDLIKFPLVPVAAAMTPSGNVRFHAADACERARQCVEMHARVCRVRA